MKKETDIIERAEAAGIRVVFDAARHYADVENWSKAVESFPLIAGLSPSRYDLVSETRKYLDEIEYRGKDGADPAFGQDYAINELKEGVKKAAKIVKAALPEEKDNDEPTEVEDSSGWDHPDEHIERAGDGDQDDTAV